MKQELSPCKMCRHSIQSTAVALRLANSHHKVELQDSSTPPTVITAPSANLPPPLLAIIMAGLAA